MELTNLHLLSAADGARLIREGVISSEQWVEACLSRVREVDGQVQAWAFLDPDHALAQARAADAWRLQGKATGPLHGVPVGVKDIFDTADMPTENGSVLYAGRTPSRDATAVAMLRAAGAVILGKTVTTEFAYFSPGKTRNPHNPSTRPAVPPAAQLPPWPPRWYRSRSAVRPTVRRFVPRHIAGSSVLSRPMD